MTELRYRDNQARVGRHKPVGVHDQIVAERHSPPLHHCIEVGFTLRVGHDQQRAAAIEIVPQCRSLEVEQRGARRSQDHDRGIRRYLALAHQGELLDHVILAAQRLRHTGIAVLIEPLGVALVMPGQEIDLFLLRAGQLQQGTGEILLTQPQRFLALFP